MALEDVGTKNLLSVIIVAILVRNTVSVFVACNVDIDCAGNHTQCMLRDCDGGVCGCSDGYYPEPTGSFCRVAKYLGQACNDSTDVCVGYMTTCSSQNHTCGCVVGWEPSSDRENCSPDNTIYFLDAKFSLLGEQCAVLRNWCEQRTEQTCSNGVCTCNVGKRPATQEERYAYPYILLQCRPDNYSLNSFQDSCEKGNLKLGSICTYDEQCPNNSSCVWTSCTRKVCACGDGYVATSDTDCSIKLSSYDVCLPTTPVADVDGIWAAWTEITGCTTTCGDGVITRSRTCDAPPPSGTGASCLGLYSDTIACNLCACVDNRQNCPTNLAVFSCKSSCGGNTAKPNYKCDGGNICCSSF